MKKRRRARVSFGTVFMLVLTALVLAGCVFFLSVIAGQDVYERTGEVIRLLSEEGIFQEGEFFRETPIPRQIITFIDEDTPAPEIRTTPTPVPKRSTITIAVGGSVYTPKAVRQSAKSGKEYDFTGVFEGIKGILTEADLAIATLETMTAGQNLGYSNYNTPAEILDALRACGVDLLALSTEHMLDKGYEGLDITVGELTRRGLACAGTSPDSQKGRATMMRIGGIQVAVLSYTYGLSETGNKQTKNDARGAAALIDADSMIQDVKQARVDGANLVIVLPHWGTKNKQDTADTLKILSEQLAQAGADVILGTHPNVVQETQRLRVTRADGLEYEAIIGYSLGSLITDSRAEENTAGMIARLDVTYDPVTRRTSLGNLECLPVYIASQNEDGRTVYRTVDAQDEDALALLQNAERQRAEKAVQRVEEAVKPVMTPERKTLIKTSGGHG